MSTRGHIVYENENEIFDYIYCGHDSYPSHLGNLLLNVYNTNDKIESLLKLGDLWCIDEDFDKCVTYKDEDVAAKVVMNLKDITKEGDVIDFTYVYIDEKWFVSNWNKGNYRELTQDVVNKNV